MKKMLAFLLALTLLAGMLPSAVAAELQHTVEKRDYVTYIGSVKSKLTEPLPLYFLDGVDDLPYLEIDDLGELLNFMNTEINEDPNYVLTSSCSDDVVTFERDSGYSAVFDFAKDIITFDDYNAFLHNSLISRPTGSTWSARATVIISRCRLRTISSSLPRSRLASCSTDRRCFWQRTIISSAMRTANLRSFRSSTTTSRPPRSAMPWLSTVIGSSA